VRQINRFNLTAIRDRLGEWRDVFSLETAPAGTVHVLRDMITLLTFVAENKIIGTTSTGSMPLKAVRQVTAMFAEPPKVDVEIDGKLYLCRSERDVWRLYFLHVLAEVGGLITTGRSRRWSLTVQGKHFLGSEPPVQLAFMLCIWWHRVNWLIAYPFTGMGGGLPRGFKNTALFQLSFLPTGADVPFAEYADWLIAKTGLVWGAPDSFMAHDLLRGSIERMIADVLRRFGAFECGYREPVGRHKTKALATIRVTPLGRALVEALALIDE
jgi:hypothetical protein